MSRLFSITSVQQRIHPVSLFQRFVQQQHVRLASVRRQPASRLVSYPSSVTSFQHCHLSIRTSNIFTSIQLHVCPASHPSGFASVQLHVHPASRSRPSSFTFTSIQLHVHVHPASRLSGFTSIRLRVRPASRPSSFTFASSVTSVPDHVHPRSRPSQITSIPDHVHPRSRPFQITSIPDHVHLRPRPSQITSIQRHVQHCVHPALHLSSISSISTSV